LFKIVKRDKKYVSKVEKRPPAIKARAVDYVSYPLCADKVLVEGEIESSSSFVENPK